MAFSEKRFCGMAFLLSLTGGVAVLKNVPDTALFEKQKIAAAGDLPVKKVWAKSGGGAPDMIRTCGLFLRREALYPG